MQNYKITITHPTYKQGVNYHERITSKGIDGMVRVLDSINLQTDMIGYSPLAVEVEEIEPQEVGF